MASRLSLFPALPYPANWLGVSKHLGGDTADKLNQISKRDIPCHVTPCSTIKNWGRGQRSGGWRWDWLPRWILLRLAGIGLPVGDDEWFCSFFCSFFVCSFFPFSLIYLYLNLQVLFILLPVLSPILLQGMGREWANSCVGACLLVGVNSPQSDTLWAS